MRVAEGFGERLWRMRDERGWTQTRLAEEAGISLTTVTHLETGKVTPRLGTIRKLAGALGVEVVELTEGKDPSKVPLGHEFLETLDGMRKRYAPGETLGWPSEKLERIATLVDETALGVFTAVMDAGYDDLAREIAVSAYDVRELLLSRARPSPVEGDDAAARLKALEEQAA